MNEPTDYAEVDHEEVILTRWEKLKNWFDILKTGFTVGKILWGFLFVSAGAVVVGEATDTKPVREVAERAGLLQPDTQKAALLARIDSLDESVEQLESALERLQAQGIQGPMGPQGPRGKTGPQGEPGVSGADIKSVVLELLPDDHDELH